MKNDSLLLTKRGKMLVFGALAFVIVGLVAILIALIVSGGDGGRQREELRPQMDPVSGETIWNIDQENELEPELQLIGFYQLVDLGFMAGQYQKIIDTVADYIEAELPGVMRASYKKDSFRYLDSQWMQSSFEFVADEKTFLVVLDTGGSLSEISVEIGEI